MAEAKNRNNIRQFKKTIPINIGMIIFGIIFIYILICVFLFFTTKHIVGYEVKMGTLSVANNYRGLALREETVIESENSGYVNYYAREGERVAVGDLVYTVDETGRFNETLKSKTLDENTLAEADIQRLQSEIISYLKGYDSNYFRSVYDFKYSIKGTVLKLANGKIIDSIQELQGSSDSSLVKLCTANQTGIVIYNVDGYEGKDPLTVSKEDFNTDTYQKQTLISTELIGTSDPVYKIATSEIWNIIIPIEKERVAELSNENYVKIRFLKNQNESWAKIELFQNEEQYFAKLELNNSMISFSTDRFIDLELITEEEQGLKIPNSAIVEKEFFLIPKDYITKGGNSSNDGYLKETYLEDGTITTEFVQTTIYQETDDEYYVDDISLAIGDYIIKPESTEKYPISKRGTLVGVYNINKGFADFSQIKVLYQNDEYSIVQSNTKYGLSVYDHIVLDAATVNEDEFIYY